jgi:hypothetical protein
MARDDHIDRTALAFVIVMTVFVVTLAYIIFPRHEAPYSPPSMSGSGAVPQKK